MMAQQTEFRSQELNPKSPKYTRRNILKIMVGIGALTAAQVACGASNTGNEVSGVISPAEPTPAPQPTKEWVWRSVDLGTYVVQPGDTLMGIANLYAQKAAAAGCADTWSYQHILYSNRDSLLNANDIKAGVTLSIKCFPNTP